MWFSWRGGAVVVPLVNKGTGDPTVRKGHGSWKRGVFIIAKSDNGETKLFVEEKRKSTAPKESDLVLKVVNGNKEIIGKFLLCSPEKKADDFYLLKWSDGGNSWKHNIKTNVTVTGCETRSRHNMGDKLTIQGSGSKDKSFEGLLKEVDLQTCKITDQRTSNGLGSQNPAIKLVCNGIWNESSKTATFYSQGFEDLKI